MSDEIRTSFASHLAAMASLAVAGGWVYVAGPLSTGPTYFAALHRGEDIDQQDVRRAHEAVMAKFVEGLRRSQDRPVVDPSVLKVPGWTDAQHGDFFLAVIERCCVRLVALDGWEFSRGASKEVVFALKQGLECLDQQGRPLDAVRARALLMAAARSVASLGRATDFLQRRLAELGPTTAPP